jgi:hypothetical protein
MFLGVALRSSLFIYGEVILRSVKKTFTHHDASSDPSSSSSSMPMDLQRLLSKGPLPWTLDVPVETSSGHASHGIPKSLNESDSTRVCGGWLLL